MDTSAEIASFVAAFVDEVNKGQIDAALRRFSNEATIVEDIAPFKWFGPNAGSQWLAAMAANAKRLGVISIVMELGEARRIEVESRFVYAVFAGTVQLQQQDRRLQEHGLLTFALERVTGQWLITALTWTGERAREAGLT